ncbi:acyltransferase [Paenibacillus thiaminolyticus]|uniref:acyltransferase n=1 Tax=Paenibacillus thiaminolyticus TaxID=49283 RepID=UPI002350BD87|nr:acyltransferase [Paenibacillus thiaminolyticus]WCR25654.1 acyltransferase [Paenibacillus thiaminolyticus]
MSRKEHITAIPIVRALAMIGVISVHSTSQATVDMVDSSWYYLYNFFNIFFKYGTPTFILLSSFVLFYNYGGRDKLEPAVLGKFYRNRLLYVIIPYIVASIGYFLMQHMMYYRTRGFEDSMYSFFTKLLTGSAYTHLYFVFISIQFYILFPLMLKLFRSKTILAWSIPLGLLLQWGFVLWNKYDLQIVNKGSISLSYVSYYFLGAYVGLNFEKIRPWLTSLGQKGNPLRFRLGSLALWGAWLLFAMLHVQVWFWSRSTNEWTNSLVYEMLWNFHTLTSAIVLMQLAFFLERKLPDLLRKGLVQLGDLSFGIYLLHPVFLALYRKYAWHGGGSLAYMLFIAGGYAVALGLSWLVVYAAFRFIPFAWIGFGAVPRSFKAKRATHQKSGSITPGTSA